MNTQHPDRPRRTLVTGGRGFLGRALVDALVQRGDDVTILDIATPPDLLPPRARYVRADLCDGAAMTDACRGVDTVFHSASLVHTKHNRVELVRTVNVDGTRSVLGACRAAGVPRLVYVSSASVVYEGRDIENGDETLPYARRFPAPYAETKRIAEEEVLSASGPDLMTCAIRPHVVFGPGDTRFLPAILGRAKAGKLTFKVGRGTFLSDFTYVTNVVDALLAAEERLVPGSPVGGQAYFITNGEPTAFWDFVRRVVEPMGFRAPRYSIPYALAYAAAAVREFIDTLRGGTLHAEEGLSRFAIRYICTHHYFSHARATRDLGYRPRVSIQQGIDTTLQSLRALS